MDTGEMFRVLFEESDLRIIDIARLLNVSPPTVFEKFQTPNMRVNSFLEIINLFGYGVYVIPNHINANSRSFKLTPGIYNKNDFRNSWAGDGNSSKDPNCDNDPRNYRRTNSGKLIPIDSEQQYEKKVRQERPT